MSALLALLASLVWGTSDYLGGSSARRAPVAWVLAIGQSSALIVLLAVTTAAGLWRGGPALLWGVLAGLVGPVALAAFYTALSRGTMGVVAPVASTGVLVPVVVGLARGERPGVLQLVGIAATVAGVIVAARTVAEPPSPGEPARGGPPGGERVAVWLACVAAVGFGLVLFFVAEGSRHSTATTLTVQRLVNVAVVGVVLGVQRRPLRTERGDRRRMVAAGLGDAGANALYAVSVRSGLVSVDAVLSSLYPVVTALWARRIDGERLDRRQAAGVATALIGVAMLAAG